MTAGRDRALHGLHDSRSLPAERRTATTSVWLPHSRRQAALRRPRELATLALARRCRRRPAAAARSDRRRAAPAAPVAVQVGAENIVAVTMQDISTGPLISGTLMAENEATVRAEVSGSILQVTAAEGQQVRRGALLARIEDQALGDAYKSAQSAVKSAEQALDVARARGGAHRESGQGRRARRARARHDAATP